MPAVLQHLLHLGSGFDCASVNEVKLAISQGGDPSKIIFANPHCTSAHVKLLQELGVKYFTFDSETQMNRLKGAPNAILRLAPPV